MKQPEKTKPVIAIALFSFFAVIIIAALLAAWQKARDAIRISDTKTIRTALEIYYNDHSGYPDTGGKGRSECAQWGNLAANAVIPDLAPTYTKAIPSDPFMKKSASDNCYVYVSDGADYAFYDYGSDINFASEPTFLDPANDGGRDKCALDGARYTAWKISSQGARCW